MRVFAVYNPLVRHRRACAWLFYEPSNDSYSAQIASWAGSDDLPALFALFVEKAGSAKTGGVAKVPGYLARRWASSRVPPKDRDNIADVLRAHHLDEYYIPSLLAKTQGRSSQDDFLVVEVDEEGYRDCNLDAAVESPVEFGVALSRARRAADLTQMQLAEASGVQQAVISRIEAGRANPTLETMELLASGCGRKLKIELE